jgi:Fe(3+) dicitrate transport protein
MSATHKYSPGDGLQLNTTVFTYTTTRNWRRQDFTYNAGASNLTGIWYGNPELPEGAIYMRNSNGHRNRTFEVAGIEPRLSYRYDLLNKTSKLDAGIRFLYERAFEQRVNGTKPDAVSGNIRNDETRTGIAFSSFIQNKVLLSDKITITAGLRNENVWYQREIFRLNNQDTLIGNTTDNFAIIPGVGINYTVNENMGIYTGLHRGYAPPRTKDAISDTGLDLELEAEKSWNFELGIRQKMSRFQAELTAFYMNFSNQIIPVSESSGGAGTGLVNGGATTHKGLEMAIAYQLAGYDQNKWSSSIAFSGTYLQAESSDDRFVLKKTGTNADKEQVFENINGNKTPYAPEMTLNASWDIEFDGMLGLRMTGNYIGEQFSDVLNTQDVAPWVEMQQNDPDFNYTQATYNGRIGVIKPYFIGDINLWFLHKKSGLELNFSVKNLFDERYIVTRRPQGIRVGMPRFISGGVSYNF